MRCLVCNMSHTSSLKQGPQDTHGRKNPTLYVFSQNMLVNYNCGHACLLPAGLPSQSVSPSSSMKSASRRTTNRSSMSDSGRLSVSGQETPATSSREPLTVTTHNSSSSSRKQLPQQSREADSPGCMLPSTVQAAPVASTSMDSSKRMPGACKRLPALHGMQSDPSSVACVKALQGAALNPNSTGLSAAAACDNTSTPDGSLQCDIDQQTMLGDSNSAAAECLPGQLQFDSRFESGNLHAAVHVMGNEYDLVLASDINDRSKGANMTQWFFFAISNALPGVSYKLNLVNLVKKDSLYNEGKRPLMCCAQSASSTPILTMQQQAASAESTSSSAVPVNSRRSTSKARSRQAGSVSSNSTHTWSSNPYRNTSSRTCSDSSSDTEPCTSAASNDGAVMDRSVPVGWFRTGQDICYYPSPYRGRPFAAPCTHAGSHASNGTASKASKKPSNRAAGDKQQQSSPKKQGHTSSSQASAGTGGKKVKEHAATTTQPVALNEPCTGPGLYCCTFTVVFPTSGTYYICNCYPYTYKDLQVWLHLRWCSYARGDSGSSTCL